MFGWLISLKLFLTDQISAAFIQLYIIVVVILMLLIQILTN